MTLHRPSNVDEPTMLMDIMETLIEIGTDLPLLFPAHPRTRQRLSGTRFEDGGGIIQYADPMGYIDFFGFTTLCGFGDYRFRWYPRGDDVFEYALLDDSGEYGTADYHDDGDECFGGAGYGAVEDSIEGGFEWKTADGRASAFMGWSGRTADCKNYC